MPFSFFLLLFRQFLFRALRTMQPSIKRRTKTSIMSLEDKKWSFFVFFSPSSSSSYKKICSWNTQQCTHLLVATAEAAMEKKTVRAKCLLVLKRKLDFWREKKNAGARIDASSHPSKTMWFLRDDKNEFCCCALNRDLVFTFFFLRLSRSSTMGDNLGSIFFFVLLLYWVSTRTGLFWFFFSSRDWSRFLFIQFERRRHRSNGSTHCMRPSECQPLSWFFDWF